MDDTDLAICRTLLENSRTPYSELAETIGLTPQAVHRRVQEMTESGIIGGTVTRLTPRALGKMWVVLHGPSKMISMAEVGSRLEDIDEVIVIMTASGNNVYVHGTVEGADGLAQFVSSIQRETSMSDVRVGIVHTPPSDGKISLSSLDLRIVSALRSDARKPVSEIASEVGITPKTVRKRLERMHAESLIQYSIQWSPDRLGDMITNLHLVVRKDAEREKVAFDLIRKLSRNVVRTFSFSNLPNELMVTMWTRSVGDMHRICTELEEGGLFDSVTPNVLRNTRYYENHLDKSFEELKKRLNRVR